jgi:hypothetical protein
LLILNFKREYGTFESVCHGHGGRPVGHHVAALHGVEHPAVGVSALSGPTVAEVSGPTPGFDRPDR